MGDLNWGDLKLHRVSQSVQQFDHLIDRFAVECLIEQPIKLLGRGP